MHKSRGKFIVVEGVDGIGKTTAIRMAIERYKGRSVRVLNGFDRRSTWGRYINANPRSFLYYVDFVARTFLSIHPTISCGTHVIQDRYIQSVDSFLPDAQFLHNRIWRWIFGPLFRTSDVFVLFIADTAEVVRRLKDASEKPRDAYHEFLVKKPEHIAERQKEYMKIFDRIIGEKYVVDTTKKSPLECAVILEHIICKILLCR